MPSPLSTERRLVSVIMPARNAAAYLAEAIESVLDQTHKEFELLIVNDASTDSTADIIQRYVSMDRRIRCLVNERQAGQSASRNRAIREARGDYVMMVDADDVCEPRRFARQLAYMEANPEIGVLGTDWIYFTDKDPAGGAPSCCSDEGVRSATPPVNNPTCCIRRQVFEKYGYFDSRYDNAEDMELWYRWASQGVILANLHECLYYKRTHADNVSVLRLRSQTTLMLRILLRAVLRDRVRFSGGGYRRLGETAAYYLYLSLRLDLLRKRLFSS